MAQILRITASLAFTEGLNPAQWAALRYFAQTVPSGRNVVAFARYHGTTKGTASQTIAALRKKGLLDRQPDEHDRRTVTLTVTPAGRERLKNDPLNSLTAAIALLDEPRHAVLADGLERVLETLAACRGLPG